MYNQYYPYVSILISLLILVANFYWLSFPVKLARSIHRQDEYQANLSFKRLFISSIVFLFSLVLQTLMTIIGFSVTLR